MRILLFVVSILIIEAYTHVKCDSCYELCTQKAHDGAESKSCQEQVCKEICERDSAPNNRYRAVIAGATTYVITVVSDNPFEWRNVIPFAQPAAEPTMNKWGLHHNNLYVKRAKIEEAKAALNSHQFVEVGEYWVQK
jgi:hypothetical protein